MPNIIGTVAGGDVSAQLYDPTGLAVDAVNLYIADSGNNRVRRVDLATQTITTFAGTGTAGFSGDGGPATAAELSGPYGLALDSRSLYIADSGNNRVRRVGLAKPTITTVAGTGLPAFAGDGGPATGAQLYDPTGLALDSGYLYMADRGNSRIRRIHLATQTITTFAGIGDRGFAGDGGLATAARLNWPFGLAVRSGYLYIADTSNGCVRRVNLG
jgi:DNA-binding beta-propeller fold protein YncE